MRSFLLLLCFVLSLHALKINEKEADKEGVFMEEYGMDVPFSTISLDLYKDYKLNFEDDDYVEGLFAIKNTSDSLVIFDFTMKKSKDDDTSKYKLIYTFVESIDEAASVSISPRDSNLVFFGTCHKDLSVGSTYAMYEGESGFNEKVKIKGQSVIIDGKVGIARGESGIGFNNKVYWSIDFDDKIPLKHYNTPISSTRLAPKSTKFLYLAYQDCETGKFLTYDLDIIQEIAKTGYNSIIENVSPMLTTTSNPNTDTVFIQDGIYFVRSNSVINSVIINKEATRELKRTGGLKECKEIDKVELKFYKNNEEKETCYSYDTKPLVLFGECTQAMIKVGQCKKVGKGEEVYYQGCIEDPKQVGSVSDFSYKIDKNDGKTYITFTVPNDENTFHRKMFLETTCKEKSEASEVLYSKKEQKGKEINQKIRYYFDARPAKLLMTPAITREHDALMRGDSNWNADDLYAEYDYPVGHDTQISSLDHLTKKEENKMLAINLRKEGENYKRTHEDIKEYNKKIKITALDGKGNVVKNYNSLVDVWIVNALYNKDKEKEPSCIGFSDTCTSNFMIMKTGENEGGIFTRLYKGGLKYLRYNNVGPTQIYARDQEWAYFSINHGGEEPACVLHSTSNDEAKDPKRLNRIGCNVGLVVEGGSTEPDDKGVNFYYFKPAVFKLKVDIANSPADNNTSYGSKYYTYMHSINEKASDPIHGITKSKDEEGNERVDIFESAKIDANILAIGASEGSFESDAALSDYDADLTIAEYIKFTNLGTRPKLEYVGGKTQTENNRVVDDVPLYIQANEDLATAIMVDVSDPDKVKKISKADEADKFVEITTTNDAGENITTNALRIDKDWTNFKAGRNISKYRLNFERNDLLSRSFIRIGASTSKLNEDIFGDDGDLWQDIEKQNISVSGSFRGDDLVFIDPAIIAPDFSSNGANDVAVFLGVYCEKDCEKYFGARIPNHIRYYAMPVNVVTDTNNTSSGSRTSLFEYDVNFSKYLHGADYLSGDGRKNVTLKLKGDNDTKKKYCAIFRNCVPLGGNEYGMRFDVFFSGNSTWSGGGEEQGDTIVDDTNNKRRKAPRMSF